MTTAVLAPHHQPAIAEQLPSLELARPLTTGLAGLMKEAGVQADFECDEFLSAFRREEMLPDTAPSVLGAALSFSDLGFEVTVIGKAAALHGGNERAHSWLEVLRGRGRSRYEDRTPSLDDLAALDRSADDWLSMLDYPDKGPALVRAADFLGITLYHADGSLQTLSGRMDALTIGTTKAALRATTNLLAVRRQDHTLNGNVVHDRRLQPPTLK